MDPTEMVPTEDAIEALLDHLVYPLLPIRESHDESPTDHQQILVAKQMHAVVILYNYYHRKQYPKLGFLGFESFCKLCCIAKPGLLSYLRYMHRCEDNNKASIVDQDQLSVMEKTVMDTCNICVELFSLKDNLMIKGWPVSKVAVFLVDRTREKCILQFCSITQGVWSLVEKVLEASDEIGSSQKEFYESETLLEQLAYSAVEQETGICHKDLCILESHLTYSLSHEKTAVRLYIMKYETALSEELTEVAIKDVMKSLEGPLVKKDVTCEVSSVVEYYHMLPHAKIISSWLSRESTNYDGLDTRGEHVVNEDKCSLEPGEIPPTENFRVKIKYVSNEPKMNVNNQKLSSETVEANRTDLSSMNGLVGVPSCQENRASNAPAERDILSNSQKDQIVHKPDQNGQDKNARNNKKNKAKDSTMCDKKVATSCKIVDSKSPLVLEQTCTREDHGISKRSGSSDLNVNIRSNKNGKRASESIKKKLNELPTNHGSLPAINKLQDAKVSQVDPGSHVTTNNQTRKEKPSQSGHTKDIKVIRKNYTEDTSTIKENISDLPANNGSLSTQYKLQDVSVVSQEEPNYHVTVKDNATEDKPSRSEQTKDAVISKKNNIIDLTPSKEKAANLPEDTGSLLENNKLQKVSDVSQVEPDNHVAAKDHATKDRPFRSGLIKDVAIKMTNNLKDTTPSNKKSSDFCFKDAITSKCTTPIHFQQLSYSDDNCGKTSISNAYTNEGNNNICNALPVSVGGSGNKAVATNKVKCITQSTTENRTSISSANLDGYASGGRELPLVPSQFNPSEHNTFFHAMVSRKHDLLQASLQVFQKKRNDLYQQKRLLQDEIARCEMNIQTILKEEGEESMTLKIESIIEALNNINSSQSQTCRNLSSEEQASSQTFKRRKLSEAVLSSVNSCQELDEICHNNSWILPKYTVVPSLSDCWSAGMFEASITIHGIDFECTATSNEPKSSPSEAREAAATQMLNTLRTWQTRKEE